MASSYSIEMLRQYSTNSKRESLNLLPDTADSNVTLGPSAEKKSSPQVSAPSSLFISTLNPLTVTLQDHYSKQNMLPGLITGYKQPIAGINLSITEYQTADKKDETNTPLEHFEALHRTPYPIAPTEIFDKALDASGKLEIKPAKQILITGAPGSGKTTMSQWFAYQWATNSFWADKFEYVFWIPLRHLPVWVREAKTELNLTHIIHRECFKDNESISVSQIATLLRDQRDRILIIADGFDEVASLFRENIDRDPHPVARLVNKILQTAYLILTSRPYQLNYLPQTNFRHLENIGFTDENIKEYVPRYFNQLMPPQPTWGENLLNFLQSNPSIWGSAHIPINLALICEELYLNATEKNRSALEGGAKEEKNKSVSENSIQNMTTLYDKLSIFLLKRYLKNHRKISCESWGSLWVMEECKVELSFLNRLAFEGLKENQVTLSPALQREILKKIEETHKRVADAPSLFDAILKSGFLQSDAEATPNEINKSHYFIHLTFQEFLAAYYLVECLRKPAESEEYQFTEQFIKSKKYTNLYQVMFGFMAGLLSLDKKPSAALIIFWELLWNEPRDLTNILHTRLMLRCLEESGGDFHIPHRKQILEELYKWMGFILNPPWLMYQPHKVILFFQQAPLVLKEAGIIDRLVKNLEDKKGDFGREVKVLEEFNVITPTIISALIALLTEKESNREFSRRSFWLVERDIPMNYCRARAVEALTKLRGTISLAATPTLLEMLTEEYSEPRIPDLIKIADIPKNMIRNFRIGLESRKLIFNQETEQILLEKLCIPSPEHIPDLIRRLKKRNSWVRRRAVMKLGNFSTPSFEIIEALISTLNDKHHQVRLNGISALDKLILQTKFSIVQVPTLIPALIKRLKKEWENYLTKPVNKIAEEILSKLLAKMPEEIVPALIVELKTNRNPHDSIMRLLSQAPLCSDITQVINKLFPFDWPNADPIAMSKLIIRGGPELVAKFVNQLLNHDKDEDEAKIQAARLLSELTFLQSPPTINNIIHHLISLLSKDNRKKRVGIAAMNALKNIAFVAPSDVAAALTQALKAMDVDRSHRKQIIIEGLTSGAAHLIKEPQLMHEFITILLEHYTIYLVGGFDQVDMTDYLKDLDRFIKNFTVEPWACLKATPLRALIQHYLKTQNIHWASVIAHCAFLRAIPLMLTSEGIYIDEGQSNDKPLPISGELAADLIQAFVKLAAKVQLPSEAHEKLWKMYEKAEPWSSLENCDTYFIQKKFSGQSIKITLQHTHPECKDPYHVLDQALTQCTPQIKKLDLSNNNLDDLSALCLAEFLKKSTHSLQILNLSHNKITAEGLEIILRALALKSSVTHCLLDHNYITFDHYFCQKIVEPLVAAARLQQLDLSMNFIYPAGMLEAKGVRGDYLKLVRDKNHPNDKMTDEKELYRRSLFEKSAVVISTPSPFAVSSLINPENKLDKDFAVISLCAFKTTLPPLGEHAFLVIESIGHLGQRSIIIGELFVVGKNVSIQVAYSSPTDFLRRVQGERIHHQCATKGKIETEKLLSEMLKSRNHQSFHRYSLFPSARQGIYNCYQWAAEMLRVIDIKIDPDDIPSVAVGKKSRCRSIPRCIIS